MGHPERPLPTLSEYLRFVAPGTRLANYLEQLEAHRELERELGLLGEPDRPVTLADFDDLTEGESAQPADGLAGYELLDELQAVQVRSRRRRPQRVSGGLCRSGPDCGYPDPDRPSKRSFSSSRTRCVTGPAAAPCGWRRPDRSPLPDRSRGVHHRSRPAPGCAAAARRPCPLPPAALVRATGPPGGWADRASYRRASAAPLAGRRAARLARLPAQGAAERERRREWRRRGGSCARPVTEAGGRSSPLPPRPVMTACRHASICRRASTRTAARPRSNGPRSRSARTRLRGIGPAGTVS